MAAKSDYLENKFLDHVLKVAPYAVPANVYVALYTAAPSDSGGGTEVTGGSYARQPSVWAAAVGGATSNTTSINFTNMPAVTVTHVGLHDAITGGNLLYHGALTAPVVVAVTNTFQFAVGELDITES